MALDVGVVDCCRHRPKSLCGFQAFLHEDSIVNYIIVHLMEFRGDPCHFRLEVVVVC